MATEDKSVWGVLRSAWDATVGRTLVNDGTIDRNHGTSNDLNAQVKQQRVRRAADIDPFALPANTSIRPQEPGEIGKIFSKAFVNAKMAAQKAENEKASKEDREPEMVSDPNIISQFKDILSNDGSRHAYAKALNTQIKTEGQRLLTNLEGQSLQSVGHGIVDTFSKVDQNGKALWADRVGMGAGLGMGAIGIASLKKDANGKRHPFRAVAAIGAGVVMSFASAKGLGNSMGELTGALGAMAGRAGQARA